MVFPIRFSYERHESNRPDWTPYARDANASLYVGTVIEVAHIGIYPERLVSQIVIAR